MLICWIGDLIRGITSEVRASPRTPLGRGGIYAGREVVIAFKTITIDDSNQHITWTVKKQRISQPILGPTAIVGHPNLGVKGRHMGRACARIAITICIFMNDDINRIARAHTTTTKLDRDFIQANWEVRRIGREAV